MATKPTSLPAWNTGGANNTEPSAGEKVTGWTVGQQPPSSYFNWWQKLAYEWTAYLDDLEAQAFTWAGAHVFNGGVSMFSSAGTQTLSSVNTGAGNAIAAATSGAGHSIVSVAVNAAALAGSFTNNANTATALKGSSTGTTSYGVHGDGAGAGIRGTGNASGAAGDIFFGGTGGFGINAQGGATNGIGGAFTGIANPGITVQRDDNDTDPVIDANGAVSFDNAGEFGLVDTPPPNIICKQNVPAAIAQVWTDDPGDILQSGFNVNEANFSTDDLIIQLNQPLADYASAQVFVSSTDRGFQYYLTGDMVSATEISVKAWLRDTPFTQVTAATLRPGLSTGAVWNVLVFGVQ